MNSLKICDNYRNDYGNKPNGGADQDGSGKDIYQFQYVDETAGNLADEAEANAKSYADETAAAAADQALADAKADTDGKLKNYVTQVNMKTSINQSAESVKTYAKKRLMHLNIIILRMELLKAETWTGGD